MKITINVSKNSVDESSDEEENRGTSGMGLKSFKRKLSSKKESTVEEVEVEVEASAEDITINAAEKGSSREVGIQVMMCDCGFEVETPEASPLPKEEVNGVI